MNQKLFLAQLLLDQGKAVTVNPAAAEIALCQAAVFQLSCAYRSYLNEIAANYRVATESLLNTVTELAEALQAADKHPAEAVELRNLEQQPGSWSNQLLYHYDAISSAQSLAVKPASDRIPLQAVGSSDHASLNYTLVKGIISGFRDVMERQRELMLEC